MEESCECGKQGCFSNKHVTQYGVNFCADCWEKINKRKKEFLINKENDNK